MLLKPNKKLKKKIKTISFQKKICEKNVIDKIDHFKKIYNINLLQTIL